MPQRLWATGDERTSIIWRLWKARVRQAGGGSGAPYVIPVKLLAHETQTTMAMCLSAGEKTTQAKCLSANTNNNGNVFNCLSAAGEFEVDCSANSLIATRSRWDNFQRSGSRQPSTSALFSSVTYQFLGLSLSHTTAKRQGEVFNSLDFISTQPHQIFSSLPRAVHERYESIRSCVSYVPCPTGSAFPSFHFLLQ